MRAVDDSSRCFFRTKNLTNPSPASLLFFPRAFAVAAAAFAVVATVGVVAVHPNGSAVLQMSSLGQDAPVVPAGGIAGGFSAIVSETKTKAATVAEVVLNIETEGTKEELETNVHALATADDKLKAASAETEKAEAIATEKSLELSQAKEEMETYQAAASSGGVSDTAQDIAKENTATLSADKRIYLNTRNTYAASTALVATNQALLATAKANSAAAMQAYVEKKAAADANRAKAEEMARAMLNHNMATKAAAEVGEESTPEGITRSQTMAEISAAATQQDILANDIQTAASLLKQAWDNRLLQQKTAQETLDAELARNAQLSTQSNKEQKDFIDSSHVAAIDATAAADAKKKAAADLLGASKRYAAAQVANEAARTEVQRLADVEEIRRQEFDAQSEKTDSIKAKTDVMVALTEEATIATKTEEIKDLTNRDAIINTISTDLATKDQTAQTEKAIADKAAAAAAADAISQSAIDEPVPEVVTKLLESTDDESVEAAGSTESDPVAATGADEAKARQKAMQAAEAAKRSAAQARRAKASSEAKKTA
jgi:hypothetical protein